MTKVLFICLGNICRSPLAEGIFISKVKEKGLEDVIEVDSCGTSKYHIGEQPDPRTRENAEQNGLKLNHQARQFHKEDFRKFDYLIPMDQANLDCISRLDQTDSFGDKITLMRNFDQNDKGADVPDPYFGGEEGFQNVFDILERSTSDLLDFIIEEQKLKAQ